MTETFDNDTVDAVLEDEHPELARLKKLMEQQEELDPELAAYLTESDDFGTILKHPLVFSIPHLPTLNAMVNHSLKVKQNGIEEAAAEGRWSTVCFLHERPYRMWAFSQWADKMDDAAYWDVLGSLWVDSENIHENEAEWTEHLSSERPGREGMMDDEERDALAKLPDMIPIHRGFRVEGREVGLSWSLDFKRAKWFAVRWLSGGETAKVATAVVRKRDVLAHFTGRGESEIVAFPEDIRDMTIREVSA